MNLNSPIGWCDGTWNPVTGCLNNCEYCYARKLAEGRLKGRFGYDNGFEPTLHADRLQEPYKLKKPSKIFVSSMGDIFGIWNPQHWLSAVMKVVIENPRHTFQFLTKFPQYIELFLEGEGINQIPSNMWVGVSVTCPDDLWRIDLLRKYVKGGIRFVSFEPLLERMPKLDLNGIDWIIIGAETGKRQNKVSPDYTWIHYISMDADAYNVPIYLKDNLRPNLPHQYRLRKEFPEVVV
jgi:protein gp37